MKPCGEQLISFEKFSKFHTKFIIVLNPGTKSYNALNYIGLYYTKIISRNSQTMLSKQKLCQIGETIIQYVHLICFINNLSIVLVWPILYLVHSYMMSDFFCGFLTYLPVDLYLIKSSCKNQFQWTGFLACKNQFRNWFLQATQAVKIKFEID